MLQLAQVECPRYRRASHACLQAKPSGPPDHVYRFAVVRILARNASERTCWHRREEG